MTSTIMVGVDGVTTHRGALAWASARAAREGARLELVYVIEQAWGDSDRDAPTQELVSAAEALLTAERGSAERVGAEVTTRLLSGNVAAELASVSAEADLLVVGGRSVVERGRSFAGSLAVRVAAAAPTSVAVVPHDWHEAGAGVVVGVDGELSSESALAFAADEAVAHGEPLHLVCAGYAANPLLAGFVPEMSLGDTRRTIVDGAERQARERHPRLEVSAEVLEAAPARGLVDAARGSRMLVLGTHNRRGVKRLMLGSVSHDVLLNLPAPVVVVRGHDDEEKDGGVPR